MIEIPESFFRGTVDREGERGACWLDTLPALVADLLERWECVLDGPVTHGGVGLIVPVRQVGEDQRAAVLKVSFPHPGNVAEPDAFEAWEGHGAVRLYARADEHFAMLLERAHESTLADIGDNDEVARIAGELHRRLTISAPSGLPRLSDRAEEMEESLLRDASELAHGLSAHTVVAAVATVRDLGFEQPEIVVHGDFHARNILRADREPWLAVDPKGYVGDPAYDGGTLLGARARELTREDDFAKAALWMLHVFAEAAELEPERVRRWAGYRAVESALWGHRHGFRSDFIDQLAAILT
jgi:streptomycin 6-kinase